MFGRIDDGVASLRPSACEGASVNSGFGSAKPEETRPFEETRLSNISLSGNCSRVSTKRRVVANQGTGASTWVVGNKVLTRGLSFG